jgi:hypothetical protein
MSNAKIEQFLNAVKQTECMVVRSILFVSTFSVFNIKGELNHIIFRCNYELDSVNETHLFTEGAIADGVWKGDVFICDDVSGVKTSFRFYKLMPFEV